MSRRSGRTREVEDSNVTARWVATIHWETGKTHEVASSWEQSHFASHYNARGDVIHSAKKHAIHVEEKYGLRATRIVLREEKLITARVIERAYSKRFDSEHLTKTTTQEEQ